MIGPPDQEMNKHTKVLFLKTITLALGMIALKVICLRISSIQGEDENEFNTVKMRTFFLGGGKGYLRPCTGKEDILQSEDPCFVAYCNDTYSTYRGYKGV